MLQSEGFDDDAGLDEAIKKLEGDLKKAKKKDADGDDAAVSALSSSIICILISCDRKSRHSR